MTKQQQRQPQQQPHTSFCPECAKSGYDKEEIMIPSTSGQRDTNILNLDDSRHVHLFDIKKYLWNTSIDEW